MKFGKQLEISANPEWRDAYVQYKRLKRLIKRVAFEIEKHTRRQERALQQAYGATGASPPRDAAATAVAAALAAASGAGNAASISDDADHVRVYMDESHPLLRAAVDEVQEAKADFWEVTGDNLRIVNDFFTGKIVSLEKSVKDFEESMIDEQNSRGHVHVRGRTLSQGANGRLGWAMYAVRQVLLRCECVCGTICGGRLSERVWDMICDRPRLLGAPGHLRYARGPAHVRADQPLGLPEDCEEGEVLAALRERVMRAWAHTLVAGYGSMTRR